MKKNAAALAVALGLFGMPGAFTSIALAADVSATEIVVGTHLDLTGPVAAGMPQLRFGTQMRFDEANEAGGVHGRKFRLIVEDNGGQPQMAVRATDKLVRSDKIFAMVNSFGSGANAAAVKRATDGGVIYFSPWGASAVMHKIAASPLLFTTTPDYDTSAAPTLSWMIDNFKARKVGFIFQEGPFGELIRPGVAKAMQSKGMTLAAEAGYKAGDIDFSSQVARMQAAGVDLIFAATITRETVGVMSEVKKLGLKDTRVITSNPGRTQIVALLGKDAVDGLYGVGGWHSIEPAKHPATQKWAADFKRRFNLEPDENALLAYAYADWFVKGIQETGRDLTTEKAVQKFQTMSYNHPIFYEAKSFRNGHVTPESAMVDQLTGGTWKPVSPVLK